MIKFRFVVFATSFLAVSCATLRAQYIGYPLLGLGGLKAGSQPGPGYYISLVYFRWNDITLHDAQSTQIGSNLNFTINLGAVPSFHATTQLKILGASYGFGVTELVLNGLVNVVRPDRSFQRTSSYGYGDLYVQPVILGWHTPHADITLGYSFWAPSGGDHGLHQWENEIDAGTTLYLDSGKKWNVSTMFSYDFSQTKNNTDVKVGNLLTLQGGAARSFLKGAGSVGAAYGAQWKMTADSGTGIPAFLPITKGRVFGVGPEINMPVFAKGKNVGLVGFRYLWLPGPKTQLGGEILVASFTFARLI